MTAAKQPQRRLNPLLIAAIVTAAVGIVLWRLHAHPPPPAPTPLVPATPAPSPPPPAPEDTVVLAPDLRAIPGVNPTTRLRYRNPVARAVKLSGSWDYWAKQTPLTQRDGIWDLDMEALHLPLGRYEFKFVTDGQWEPGDNRVLYVNLEGKLERPSDVIYAARLETPSRIDILFRHDVPRTDAVRARLIPNVAVSRVVWRDPHGARNTCGYAVAGDYVTFYMDEHLYDVSLSPADLVTVAGSFNGWRTDGVGGLWQLHDADTNGVWSGTVHLEGLGTGTNRDPMIFKFVINNQRWLPAPTMAPNAQPDGEGHLNLHIDPRLSASTVLEVHTAEPLALSNHYVVVLENLDGRTTFREVSPGAALDAIVSSQPLGPQLGMDRGGGAPASALALGQGNPGAGPPPGRSDRGAGAPAPGATTFRLFAPRASAVALNLYDGPYYQAPDGGGLLAPRTILPMQSGTDGVWDVTAAGVGPGQYYVFRVDGPPGSGEGFSPLARVADPYARALAHGDNNAIVIDPAATNAWFGGWTDRGHRTPAAADAVIYETHVRDFSFDPDSRVPDALRGKYAGMLATQGLGTGLDHLKALGVNVIELMPVAEFANGTNRYDWGYGPAFYFAPEASYARDPLHGSQYYEFNRLVDELHRQGFAVILDMVYNHIGSPNVFFNIDRKYFFRQDQDYNLSNFSGCGNDVRTEAPMMRRLIVDNIRYWLREHHVDGFRFDLAELIDMDTLMAVRDAARAEKPDVILISEPWSFRGDHRQKLKGKGYASWNGEFRWCAQHFVQGAGNRDELRAQLRGSVDTWAATPLQSINYLESHDDMAFADLVTANPGQDGRNLTPEDAARDRLAATILMTALGVPMLAEGQDWIRSKHGFRNTFDRGDAINALHWEDRERPEAAATSAYYRDLIGLRRSQAGRTFRWDQAVPADYFEWVTPPDGRALGYVMNGTRQYPGLPFAVLLNAADRPTAFTLRFPPGNWRLIGDGRRLDARGIPGAPLLNNPDGTRTVTVPAMVAYVYVGT